MPLGLCLDLESVIATEENKNVTTKAECSVTIMDVASSLWSVSIRCGFLFPMLVKYEMGGTQIVPREVNRLLFVVAFGNITLVFSPPCLA